MRLCLFPVSRVLLLALCVRLAATAEHDTDENLYEGVATVPRLLQEGRSIALIRQSDELPASRLQVLQQLEKNLQQQKSPLAIVLVRDSDVAESPAFFADYNVSQEAELTFLSAADKSTQLYEGDFDAAAILEWLEARVESKEGGEQKEPLKELVPLSPAQLADFLEAAPVSVVVAAKFDDEEAAVALDKLREARPRLHVARINTGDAEWEASEYAAALPSKDSRFFIYYKGEEQPWVAMDEDFIAPSNAAQLKHYVDIHARPYVESFPAAAQEIFTLGIPKIAFYFAPKHDEKHVAAAWARALGGELRGHVIIAHVDSDDAQTAGIREFLGVKEVPTIRGFNGEAEKQYRPAKEAVALSEEEMAAFARAFKTGTIEPYRRGEAAPADWDAQPLKVLVADTFDEVARDASRGALVMFHASWCGHCKALMPTYEKLAEAWKTDNRIVIAKIEATQNDVDVQHKIRGFPTLLYFAAGTNEEIEYNGGRTLDDLIKFIEEQLGEKAAAAAEEEAPKDEL